MGAPLGNDNRASSKRWAAAIERALARHTTQAPPPDDVSDLIRGLDAAASLFVSEMFTNKDLPSFKELGDRLDGKAAQSIEATVKGDLAGVLTALGSGNDSPVAG